MSHLTEIFSKVFHTFFHFYFIPCKKNRPNKAATPMTGVRGSFRVKLTPRVKGQIRSMRNAVHYYE